MALFGRSNYKSELDLTARIRWHSELPKILLADVVVYSGTIESHIGGRNISNVIRTKTLWGGITANCQQMQQ